MDIKKLLKKQALFKNASDETLDFLKVEANVLDFEPGEQIVASGHGGKYFGIVLKGKLEVLDAEGNRMGEINEGEFMGEMSLLTGERSFANVQSLAVSRVVLIPNQAMSHILPQNPGMIQQFATTMRARLLKRETSSPEEKDAMRAARGEAPGPEDLMAGPGGAEMRILVINCGSSSLKWNFFDTSESDVITGGLVERIGSEGTVHIVKDGRQREEPITRMLPEADHGGAFQDVVDFLVSKKGPIKSLKEIDAIGHRTVHGGEKYTSPVVIDDDVIGMIRKLSALAPLHNPVNLVGIEAAGKILPDVPQVAVFDTAFHQTMPPHAYLYALPYQYYKENDVRRYGFHGTSHHYVAMQAAAYVKKPMSELKIISCHLGNGASICAIDHGRSIDTSMGLTPLEGLVMGSRAGDVDPGILFHLARKFDLSAIELDRMLNKESGLLGLSGVSNDMREISAAAAEGNQQALQAIQVFCYRIKKYIGAYIAALDGVDVLIFTGGIGLGAAGVRARVCQGLARLGVILDVMTNRSIGKPDHMVDISDPMSLVKVMVIPTNEEKMIARETMRALRQSEVSKIIEMPANRQREIPVHITTRHVHLSREHADTLFGKGHSFQKNVERSRPFIDYYKENVNLVGPKGKIQYVRVIGPLRDETQVEVGRAEEFQLGVDAPLRAPGDLAGTPGITIEGPKGKVDLQQGFINAQRHIRMEPEDALAFGLRDGDRVVFAMDNPQASVFGDVLIVVSSKMKLEMHMNTDDAKEAEITEGMNGRIIGIVERSA